MQTILVICATHRDRRELQKKDIAKDYTVLFDEVGSAYSEQLEKTLSAHGKPIISDYSLKALIHHLKSNYTHVDGLISSDDYPGISVASLIAHTFGAHGPSLHAVLACQHKYCARTIQAQSVPEATPQFAYIDLHTNTVHGIIPQFPCFTKPIRSYFSVNAQPVYAQEDIATYLSTMQVPHAFYEPFNELLSYANIGYHAYGILIEELLGGIQCTLEGFVYNDTMHLVGIVDSIMYPGTMSFERFEYPSSLPHDVQQRMVEISYRIMRSIGFDNGLFNIEFMYNPEIDSIHIIEINPRMCSQFADLYEKVDGFNTYRIALDLAVGKFPRIVRNQGNFKKSASCVLRLFKDHYVEKVPHAHDCQKVYELFPDVRIEIHAHIGKKLSEELQDGKSYRYAVINVGGNDKIDILKKLETCTELLPFVFKPL